jgi:multidrug transporter EmrE-like cation transporter
MKYAIALVIALSLNATANLMIKFGMERFKAAGVSPADGTAGVVIALITNWVLIGGLCCVALNVGFYAYALKALPISVAYPIMVTVGFAIIVAVAGMYLHERLTSVQWVGVCLILVGVWLVASQAANQLQKDGTGPPATAEVDPGPGGPA